MAPRAKQGSDRTETGKFRSGVSGNPNGRPRLDAAAPESTNLGIALGARIMEHMDGWTNAQTGLGIAGKDKTVLGTFEIDVVTSDQALFIWRGDPVGARIVEDRPSEATRQGFELQIGDVATPDYFTPPEPEAMGIATKAKAPKKPARTDSTTGFVQFKRATKPRRDRSGRAVRLDAEDGKELQETIDKQLKDLGALDKIKLAMCHERAGGGAAILLGANDFATDLRTPFDIKRARALEWATVLESSELIPLYYYNDPFKPKFGQVAIYQLAAATKGASIDGYVPRVSQIHESRLIVFPGTTVSRRMPGMSSNVGWGDSVFTRIVRALRGFNTGHQSAEVLLSDFAQAVYKIKGLAELVSRNPNALTDSMMSVEIGRSICRAVVIDSEEDFERKSTSLSGYPEMLDRFALNLAAAAGMPLERLTGQPPQGLNANGSSGTRNYYDLICGDQQDKVAPALTRFVEILLAVNGEDPDSVNHSLSFRPLWQPTAKEQAEERKLVAETDAIYLNAQVYSPEECAYSRFGGEKFSSEMHIDFEARKQQLAITAPVVNANPEPPPAMGPDGKPLSPGAVPAEDEGEDE